MNHRNPDDLALLSRIRFKVRKYATGISVDVYDGADRIGVGKFFFGPFTDLAPHKKLVVSPALIEVQKPWRRKGVASAIYRKLESLGYTIHPSSSQTPDGISLWRGGRWGKRDEVVNSGILSRWKTEYERPNPYKSQLVWWVEPDGKVHSNEDTASHAIMAGELLGMKDLWAAYGKAINDLGWVRGMTDIGGGRGYFNWAVTKLPTERQRTAIARLVRGSSHTEWDRVVGRWTYDGDDRVERGSGFPWSAARKNPGDEAELVRLAFEEYGVTRNFAECGYIMTDGRMLDFSEKRNGGNPGTRSLDHRNVYGIVKKAGFEVENRGYGSESNSVKAFLEACGAVRVMFMEGGGSYRGKPVGNIFYLHVARRPTAAQLLTISSAIRKYNPELVQVAFGESVDMVEIEPVTAGRVRQVLESIS